MNYYISYKNLIGLKPLRIIFDKTDRIMRIYDGTRCLVLFGTKKSDATYDKVRYLISIKSDMAYIFSHYFAKIKVASYDSFLIEKILTLHNVIIHIKSVLNKR